MVLLIALLIISMLVQLALYLVIGYQKRCIEDLEVSKKRILKRKQGEILEILYHIQELTDYRKSYSKETIREYVNKKIELNTTTTNENV